MRRSLIVAMAENGVIGVENRLPWRLPADLALFRRLTMGHHLVMGRLTYESIGQPLSGRTTVVLTRSPRFNAPGVLVARSVGEAFALAEAAGDSEPFVCGGAEIYELALPLADRVYLTVIERDYTGDRVFSGVNDREWGRTRCEVHAEHDPPFRFEIWDRKRRLE